MITVKKLLFFLLLVPVASISAASAYQALRVVGAEKGEPVLRQIISMRGLAGSPEPDRWKIFLDDPDARGGVRELEVGSGRVISERTPVRDSVETARGPAINLQQLNLDSGGAFEVAERESRRLRIGFDSIDYSLRSAEDVGAPVWILQLRDIDGNRVGELHVAADTGRVLGRTNLEGRTNLDQGRQSRRDDSDVRPEEYEEDRSEGTFYRVERAFRRVGGSLQEMLTGRRTIDRKYSD